MPKPPSTTITSSCSSHHRSVRRVAGITSPRWLRSHSATRAALLLIGSVSRIFLGPILIEIAAVTVVDDDRREIIDLEPADRLRAQILVRDELHALDEPGQHRPGAADRAEVHTGVLAQSGFHLLRTVAL